MLAVAAPSAEAPNAASHNLHCRGPTGCSRSEGWSRCWHKGSHQPPRWPLPAASWKWSLLRPLLLAAFRGDRAGIDDTLRKRLDDPADCRRDEVAASGLFSDPVTLTRWTQIDGWLSRVTGAGLRRSKGLAMFRHHTQVIEWLKESPDGLKIHDAEWAAYRSRMTGACATPRGLVRPLLPGDAQPQSLQCVQLAAAASLRTIFDKKPV